VVGGVDWQEGGSRLGDDASGQIAFEPRDGHKGNAARALLYMHLRYGLVLTDAEWERYRGWHDADPPDARDHARNLGIRGWQGNANPFIACPQTVHDVVVPTP
jgi:endonuclease I